jgi:hypothetical protein
LDPGAIRQVRRFRNDKRLAVSKGNKYLVEEARYKVVAIVFFKEQEVARFPIRQTP